MPGSSRVSRNVCSHKAGAGPVAAPAPVGGIVHESCSHGVEDDVGTQLHHVGLGVDQLRPERACEEMPIPLVPAVELERVASDPATHARAEIWLRRLDHDVDMRVHEAVRVYQPAVPLVAPGEPCQESAAVVVVEDDRRLCIPASDHVLDRSGGIDPRLTRHAKRIAGCGRVRTSWASNRRR